MKLRIRVVAAVLLLLLVLVFIILCLRFHYYQSKFFPVVQNQMAEDFTEKIVIGIVTCAGGYKDNGQINVTSEESVTLIKSILISAKLWKAKYLEFHVFTDSWTLSGLLMGKLTEFGDVLSEYMTITRYTYNVFQTVPPGYERDFIDNARTCGFVRLFFPDFLPDSLNEILYLDTDVIITGNIITIWKNFKDKVILERGSNNQSQLAGMVQNSEVTKKTDQVYHDNFQMIPHVPPRGVNSGVMFMNLAAMREFNWTKKVVKIYKEWNNTIRGDQQLVNVLFHDHLDRLTIFPCQYNFQHLHCEQGLTCKNVTTDKGGIYIMHGAGGTFHKPGRSHSRLYNAFKSFNLELHHVVKSRLMAPLRKFYRVVYDSFKYKRPESCQGTLSLTPLVINQTNWVKPPTDSNEEKIVIGVMTCAGETISNQTRARTIREATEKPVTLIKSVLISAKIGKARYVEFHIFTDSWDLTASVEKRMKQFKAVMGKYLNMTVYYHSVFESIPHGYNRDFIGGRRRCGYVRVFFPTFLPPTLKGILYLDTDVIITGNILKIWKDFKIAVFENENSAIEVPQLAAMVPNSEVVSNNYMDIYQENFRGIPHVAPRGVNSGVMFMNLEAMREYNWTERMIKIFRERRKTLKGDQQLINIFFHDNLKHLTIFPCQYNFQHLHCEKGLSCRNVTRDPGGILIMHGAGGMFHAVGRSHFHLYQTFKSFNLSRHDEVVSQLFKPLKKFYSLVYPTNNLSGRISCYGIIGKYLFRQLM